MAEDKKRITLKSLSDRLNYVTFDENGKPRRVRKGETFQVRTKGGAIPAKWEGLCTIVDGDGGKKAVTNPVGGGVKKQA